MTTSEVVNKLSYEMAVALGDFDALPTCKRYIEMALSIGIEHFTKDMEEIIQMDRNGVELGRYKSAQDASQKTGIYRVCITDVVNGRAPTAGGFIFMKTKDKELISAKKTA